MSQSQLLKISGLYTSFNELSEVPEGALAVADNIDILQNGLAQPRRGFERVSSLSGLPAAVWPDSAGGVITHYGPTIASANTVVSSGVTMGSINASTGTRMKFCNANSNIYAAASNGVYRLGASNTTLLAGGYKGLDITASTSSTAGSLGWVGVGDQYAYRHVWTYKDVNKNLVISTPSQREVITSTDIAKGVDLAITIPSGVTTSWTLQIYRSLSVTAAVVAAGGTPSDELFLAKEVIPSSGEISAKAITVTDTLNDSLLGATLYTSSTQEGLAGGNETPPLAEDLASYAECMFFGGVTTKYRYFLTLALIGGSGLVADDTITINGIVYTAKGSETAASAQFKVTGSTTTTANVEATMKSLVRVINQYSGSLVYAYYISGVGDSAGQVLIEERSVGGAAFGVVSSRKSAWTPTNSSIVTTIEAINDGTKSLLAWSKPNQPEHVPVVNYVRVGAKNDPILRILSLQEGLYVFKTSGQVYKLTGVAPSFYIEKVEDSFKLVARNSLVVLNDSIYGLTDQGVMSISGSGPSIVSRPIEQDLLDIIYQMDATVLDGCAFGVSFSSDHKYCLYVPAASSNTYATVSYVLNTLTGAWVRHTVAAHCGVVGSTGRLYIGSATENYTWKERRAYTFTDYGDPGSDISVTNVSSTTITVSGSIDLIVAGDIFYYDSLFASITAVDAATSTLTLETNPGFTGTFTATIIKGIAVSLKWVPNTFGNPSMGKQFHTTSLLFKSDFLGTATIGFTTDQEEGETLVTIAGRGQGLWGLFNWGEEPWGGESVRRPLRQWVPRAKQRGSLLSVSFNQTWAYSNWVLSGVSVFGEFGGEGFNRG